VTDREEIEVETEVEIEIEVEVEIEMKLDVVEIVTEITIGGAVETEVEIDPETETETETDGGKALGVEVLPVATVVMTVVPLVNSLRMIRTNLFNYLVTSVYNSFKMMIPTAHLLLIATLRVLSLSLRITSFLCVKQFLGF